MKAFISKDSSGRITASTTREEFAIGMDEVDLPDDFDFSAQHEYRIEAGGLVHDPLPPSEEELEAQRQARRREQMEAATVLFVQTASLTDEQALTVSELFREWAAGMSLKAGEVIRHGDEIYRVTQDHTSQAQWEPGEGTESLYTKITKGGDGVDVWQQPTGAHDAYSIGDRVHYPDGSGPIYVSTIDGNVWSPDAYPQGWELEA